MEKIKARYTRPISDGRILIVDDEPINCEIMEHMLGSLYQVSSVYSGEEAIAVCHSDNRPDLVLLDIMMGGMSGIETCRAIKTNDYTANIPIIFITAVQDEQQQTACWDAGGVDFVVKPVNGIELRNRVRAHLTHKLQTDLLLTLTYVDKLTGAYNRHYLDDVQPKLEKISKRNKSPLSILMIDIDWFKLYNDHFGHVKGDRCLRVVADEIVDVLQRPADLLVRFGGEEFMGLLVDTDNKGAIHVAEKILERIKTKNIDHPKSQFSRISVSIGVATLIGKDSKSKFSDVIQIADNNLYEAKSLGRNQVKG